MTERQPSDQAVRDAALDPGRNCIVQAPAGSGKTELLTQRFLRLLALVERPDEIVAITFTRKAAGEMRDRILDSLRLGQGEAPPAGSHRERTWALAREALERDAARGWRLLENPRRLRIETIDALNAWLARQLPLSSRLGAPPAISDDPEPIYREAARQVLLATGSDEAHAPHSAALLRHLGGRFEQAEDLLVALLKSRDHWLGKVIGHGGGEPAELRALLESALRHLVDDELARAQESLPLRLREALANLAAGAARRAPGREALAPLAGMPGFPAAESARLGEWRALAELLLTGQGEWRRRLTKNEGFPADARQAKAEMAALLEELAAAARPEALHRVRRLPEPDYGEQRWEILSHLLALLPVCAASLEVEFAARGESDYIGIARAALDALGTPEAPTDLALALDCRISHLLVDEFQDTSQSQVDLLERLTAGWSPGDGRSLFCVGDPMQSIYRFREADVGRFLKAQRAGIGGLPLENLRLSVNFRSQAALVEWVSQVFPGIFPEHADLSLGAVPFAPSIPWHATMPGEAVSFHAAPPLDGEAEAQLVVDIVREARSDDPDASVAVLVRGRRHLARITPALKAAGIACRAVEIEPLGEVPAIRDLEALTRALCHRADRTAWLAVLRAPWCGLELGDLLLAAGARHEDLWLRLQDPDVRGSLSVAGQARIEGVVAALGPALQERGKRPLSRVVEGAWLALGGPATLRRESELADARSFFEFLERRASHGDLDDPPAFAELLAELYAAPESPAGQPVELLTIHKAKGLEFDHVVLPGLGRRSGRREKTLLRWLEQVREEGTELILAPVEALGEARDPLHGALRELDDRRDWLELDRLLYVAATRARRRLHLVAELADDDPETGEPPQPQQGTLLARLWPATAAAFLASRAGAGAPVRPEAQGRAPVLKRLEPGWAPPEWPAPVQWIAADAEPAEPGRVVEYDWSGREARAVGVAVHRLLHVISGEGPAAWPPERVAAQAPLLATFLREEGLAQPERDGSLRRCLESIRHTLADPRGQWILDPAHRQAASERRISGWLDGRIFNGIMDRSFVDADGTLWIIDYKAGRHEGAALEEFLDREQERYRPQLERYARLLSAMHPGPIRLGLYFPQHAAWREWEAPPAEAGS